MNTNQFCHCLITCPLVLQISFIVYLMLEDKEGQDINGSIFWVVSIIIIIIGIM